MNDVRMIGVTDMSY